jgi:hypothetical protein
MKINDTTVFNLEFFLMINEKIYFLRVGNLPRVASNRYTTLTTSSLLVDLSGTQ